MKKNKFCKKCEYNNSCLLQIINRAEHCKKMFISYYGNNTLIEKILYGNIKEAKNDTGLFM